MIVVDLNQFSFVLCKVNLSRYAVQASSGMMEAVRTSETSVDNYFTRQYIPEDNSEQECSFSLLTSALDGGEWLASHPGGVLPSVN
jgi:hypothetical protein